MKFLCLSIALFSASSAFADHHEMSKEMKAKMEEYSTPSEAHKRLAEHAGKWKYTSKWWMSPDAKPEETSGTAEMKMILGGRYLLQTVKGKAMGQNYEGQGVTGYDNLKKEYFSTWMDNMGTGMVHGTGSYDESTKTYHDKGSFTCPMERDNQAEYRSEWKITGPKSMVFSMYTKHPESRKEYKSMEMVYTRK